LDAAAGDRAAFSELYRRYAGMVYAIALGSFDRPDADDVVQEVFLQALRHLPRLRSPEAFGRWLSTITRNTVRSTFRRRAVEAGDVVDVAIDPAHGQHLEARAALGTIRELPRAYRETLMMRLVEGMTGPEIAERTGLTPASVRVNLHRGMKLLRTRLDSTGRKVA
jgi:RNA polymerase sigma-70 factor (ECF subfamily)